MDMTHEERDDIKLAVIQNDLTYIKERMTAIDTKVSSSYVTRDQFEPVRRLVYGLVSLILTAVVLGVVGLVINISR